MQSWDSCSSFKTPTANGYTVVGIMRDSRDQKTYQVRKFNDGKCWMVDNLRYGGVNDACSGKSSFSGFDNVVGSAWGYGDCRDSAATGNGSSAAPCTSSAVCGYYYNFQAATQIASCYNDGTVACTSGRITGICPDGWHLPSSSEFNRLASDNFDSIFWIPASSTQFSAGFRTIYACYIHYDGYLMCLFSTESSGWWWSSTPNLESARLGYGMYVDSSGVHVSSDNYRRYGSSVRCVKN
jgi:uncharacterized protein (TIGR02145 family)